MMSDDVISGRNVKTAKDYIAVNFEVPNCGRFRDFPKLQNDCFVMVKLATVRVA